MLKLWKTDFSLGRSIVQVDSYDSTKPVDADGPDNLIQIADELNLSQVILVEDNLGGFIYTYKLLSKLKKSMIFGWRVSFVQDAADLSDQPSHKNIIFVKNEKGWKKVIKLATAAQTTNFHKEPRLDYKTLHDYWGDELVLAVPFYDSFIHKNLTTKDTSIPDFRGIQPWFFVEKNDVPFDNLIEKGVQDYVAANGGEIVDAKSIYYRNRADCYIYQARRLFERKTFKGGTLEEPNMEFFCSDEFCLESALDQDKGVSESEEKFLSLFNEPLELFLPGIRLPEVTVPKEDRERYQIPANASNTDILRIIARAGYKEKMENGEIPPEKAQIYGKQVEYELKSLEELRFTDYILLIWLVTSFSQKNNLPMGMGRGSCCSSLLNWLISATGIDPIKHDLYFERFVNPSRGKIVEAVDPDTNQLEKYIGGSPPDADLDCSIETRDRIVAYLNELYPGKMCKLGTFSTYTTKAITKDCAKIIGGFAEEDIRSISDEIPVVFGRVASPQGASDASEKYKAFMDENPRIWKAIRKLHECKKAMGVHPSAFILSYKPLADTFPLAYASDGSLMAVVDMVTSESIAIKLDLLGLDAVSLIYETAKAVDLDISKFDFDSPKIYNQLKKIEHPVGLFQVSGHSGVSGCNLTMPRNLSELAGTLSAIRPGSMAYLQQYADYLAGKTEALSLHPAFDEILKPTGGVLLFQEQILKILSDVFGFSLANAENVRKCLGKKNAEEMAKWESKVYEQAKEKGIDSKAADVLWSLLKSAADYSFNKSLHLDTIVETRAGFISMKEIGIGDEILAYNVQTKSEHYVKVIDIDIHKAILWRFATDNNEFFTCSMEHKFLTEGGMKAVRKIFDTDLSIITKIGKSKIISAAQIGIEDSIDFEVDSADHNFFADGMVTSNSHAVAYGSMAALSIFLKFEHSLTFFLQALKLSKQKSKPTEEVAEIARELPYFGIKLLPPDLIKSDIEFKIEGNNIRYGLSSIKSVAEKSISKIQQFINKETTNIVEMFQSARQAKINSTVFLALIETGALESFSEDRQRTSLCWRVYSKMTDKERQYALQNAHKYDYDIITCLKNYMEWVDSSGKKIGKESRLNTLRRDCEPYFRIYRENSKHPNLSEFLHEKILLGFSSHKLRELFVEYPHLHSINQIKTELYEKDKVRLVAEVLDVHVGTAKKSGKKYCRIDLADETGTFTAGFFGDKWETYKAENPEPEEGQILYVTGERGADIIWGNTMIPLRLDVFMRVRDLRKLEKKELTEIGPVAV